MTQKSPYNPNRINVILEKYDFDRVKKYVGDDKDFSNASAFARYAIIRLLEYLETKQTYNLNEPEK